MLNADELRAFEAEIAQEFNAGRIKAPVHLSGGCEDQIIEIFKDVREQDWVFSNWRSHYHCLLKGVPPAEVKAAIMAGRSITLCFPEHRFLSSAIVGGNLPIALGVALSIKRRGGDERVWAFCGEMTARTGIFHECLSYAVGHGLPIAFVIEDNGKSVCTPTAEVWGEQSKGASHVRRFSYSLPFPHSGAGVRVEF
jgi:TPP-dependent pyruvate/acetoin dehydrogenase alpha subunit